MREFLWKIRTLRAGCVREFGNPCTCPVQDAYSEKPEESLRFHIWPIHRLSEGSETKAEFYTVWLSIEGISQFSKFTNTEIVFSPCFSFFLPFLFSIFFWLQLNSIYQSTIWPQRFQIQRITNTDIIKIKQKL